MQQLDNGYVAFMLYLAPSTALEIFIGIPQRVYMVLPCL